DAEWVMTQCSLDYYDVDAEYSTGCECDDSTANHTCAKAIRLPATAGNKISSNQTETAIGLVPDGTARLYYQIEADDADAAQGNGSKLPGTLVIYIDDPTLPGNPPADAANTNVRFRVFEDTGAAGCSPFSYTVPTVGSPSGSNQTAATGEDVPGYATHWTWSD